MANEKKEKEEDNFMIEGVEEFPYGIKKKMNVNTNIQIKNFKVVARKISVKFPVEVSEKAFVEKTKEGEKGVSEKILKGGDEVELKNVSIEEGSINVKIPQIIQEIISSKGKQ